MKRRLPMIVLSLLCAITVPLRAQQAHDHDSADPNQLDQATEAMSHHHHEDMGPHMKMSALREPRPGDQARAVEIVANAKAALERYKKDVKNAEADGFRQFLPNVKQKMYHYTSWANAVKAGFSFDPANPTSLLYEKQGDGSMKLIGAMYTAPARLSEDQLQERIPLSVAQWHLHVNLCLPPKDRRDEMFKKDPQFGLNGSITTKEACDAAGGFFMPRIFGWMVHLYPYEKSMDEIWSVARQKNTVIPQDERAEAHQH
ncbi:MAG: hypothetical protein HYX26_01345 [Acidobacteriales bacterium]|nr:hypothetical protein [Terriglobales bacterium]